MTDVGGRTGTPVWVRFIEGLTRTAFASEIV